MQDIHKPTPYSRVIHSEYRKVPGEKSPGRVSLRYDDTCGNGKNSFGITMESRSQVVNYYGGCMHDTIRKVFPEYAHLIKWHLFDTNGPMHYTANTLYYAEDQKAKALVKLHEAEARLEAYKEAKEDEPCGTFAKEYITELRMLKAKVNIAKDRYKNADGPILKYARKWAAAPDATIEQLQDEQWLVNRLPGLIEDFKAAMDTIFVTEGVS